MSETENIELHKLYHKWSFYEQVQFYNSKNKGQAFKDSFEKICEFDSVEGFWMNWNKIPSVTKMFYDGEFRVITRKNENFKNEDDKSKEIKIEGQTFFKEDILPLWEDDHNKKGGELRVSFDVSAHKQLGQFWEMIVLTMVGETMDESDLICGARILDKSKPGKGIDYRLEIWYADWNDTAMKTRLEQKVRKMCDDFNFENAKYKHEEHIASKWL